MVRISLMLAATSLLGTACALPLDPSLEVVGTVFLSSDGIALFDDGRGAHAGMLGSTCELNTRGGIGDEFSVGGQGRPEVLGGDKDDHGDDVVLVRTGEGLHLLHSTLTGAAHRSTRTFANVNAPDLHAAALTRQGTVALHGCTVSFLGTDLSVEHESQLERADCSELSLAADPAGHHAFVTDGAQLWSLTPDNHSTVELAGDALGFNTGLRGLLLADDGGTEVRTASPTGEVLWATDLGDPVIHVQDFPNSDTILVVSGADEVFSLTVLDAHTGQIQREIGLPRLARVHTSPDGQTFALARPNSTQFVRWR